MLAAQAFAAAGYNAHNLDGGLKAWVADGLPIDPADGHVGLSQSVSWPS